MSEDFDTVIEFVGGAALQFSLREWLMKLDLKMNLNEYLKVIYTIKKIIDVRGAIL